VMERASILVEQSEVISAEHLYFSNAHNSERHALAMES